ncbi:MAG: squalene/phytoene synthase family protein [Pseudomonadota bacterium]
MNAPAVALDDPLGALRTADPDRCLQVALARSGDRAALLALYLLNVELARIPGAVNEPMAGLIRLQWWRDALANTGGERRHPVLSLIAETGLAERLPDGVLDGLIAARERELDPTPLLEPADLEPHARATAGALAVATAHLIGASPVIEKARVAGTAYGMLGIIRAIPFVARPTGSAPATLADQARAVAERTAALLREGHPFRGRGNAPCLLPALFARQDLRRLRALDYDVFDGRLHQRPPWTALSALAASLTGRF